MTQQCSLMNFVRSVRSVADKKVRAFPMEAEVL